MSQYFPKLYKPFGGDIKVKIVNLSNYAAKTDLKNVTHVDLSSIDISAFVLKTKYDADKLKTENKIPNTSDLVKKADYNTKIIEIKGKIPDVSSLAAKAVLAVENKIIAVSSLVKKNRL